MTPSRFKRRTHALRLPEEIQKKYEEVCQRCEVCSRLAPAPSRSRVSGLRAQKFGDLLFIDHTKVQMHGKMGISSWMELQICSGPEPNRMEETRPHYNQSGTGWTNINAALVAFWQIWPSHIPLLSDSTVSMGYVSTQRDHGLPGQTEQKLPSGYSRGNTNF